MEDIQNTSVETNETNNATEQQEEEVKTYTAEEVAKLIQAEADRRTNQALSKQKKEYERKLSLSKLDDEQRAKAEKDNRIAELEEQLAQFQIEKNKSELKTVLATRGLSAEFADIINISDDIEAAQANIDRLDKLFKAAVKAEVEKRLAGNAPKRGADSGTEITRDSVKKMSLAQLNELMTKQPELYNKFFN